MDNLKRVEPSTVFAPNSIYHGCLLSGIREDILVKISHERRSDFIDYIVENYITERTVDELAKEFDDYELSQFNH